MSSRGLTPKHQRPAGPRQTKILRRLANGEQLTRSLSITSKPNPVYRFAPNETAIRASTIERMEARGLVVRVADGATGTVQITSKGRSAA